MATIEVQLSGGNGSRTTEVNQPDAESRERAWSRISKAMAVDTIPFTITPNPTLPTPDPSLPTTINEVFASFIPQHIASTRWGRYVVPGQASRVFDGTLFVYHNPCDNFWNIYNLAGGIFKTLGIRLCKNGGVWNARIPIAILTDRIFVDSGLASVENTLMAHTGSLESSCVADVPPRKVVSGFRITGRMIKHAKEVKVRHAAEKAYWKRWDVESKRKVALKRLAELSDFGKLCLRMPNITLQSCAQKDECARPSKISEVSREK